MSAKAQEQPALIGYVTPLSARPGEQLNFKISSHGDMPISAKVVKLDCCDPNPRGPGLKSTEVEFGLSPIYPAVEQTTHLGSCAFGSLPSIPVEQDLVVELVVRPGVISATDQTIFSLQNSTGTKGVALIIKDGKLFLRRHPSPAQVKCLDLSLKLNVWSRLEVIFSDNGVIVRTSAVETSKLSVCSKPITGMREALIGVDHICLAALWSGHPEICFDGSIEAPRLSVASKGVEHTREIIAQWTFTDSGNSVWVSDDFDLSSRLNLINLPMRAVRSSSWTGHHMDWKVAPQEYAAITFHSDDLSDCAWETTIALTVPDDVPSGVYGLVVDNEIATDTIPFYVLPGVNAPRKKIVFLAPTFTYMAYANHARGNFTGPLEARVKDWGAYPHNPDIVGSYGYSTYNRHPDGTGVTISSRLRPIMTMRPGYLVYLDEHGSGMRGFPADSHLTDWLTTKGFAFDVLTDEDLDRDGVDALSPYDVVLTGSHPEYHTRRTIEAILAYRQAGGRLMYLGGNGFYWKIGRDQNFPHILELRRAEGGMRVWASKPGEYYNQLDGEYGGLWRRNGIPPQKVAGVGFTAEGNFEGTYYLRTDESFAEDIVFLFEGISADERLGDFGLSGGGAAGFEIDQACAELGTPDFVKVVAASERHGPSFKTTYEELLTPGVIDGGPRPYGGMRSNIVYGLDENGGGLFSVGSITFCGSLSHNGYDNNISRLLENCLLKFLSTPHRVDDAHAPSAPDTIPPIGSNP